MKIVLCMLVRNELPCLKILLPQIPKTGKDVGYDEVVAIDGMSTDGTVEFLKTNGVLVIEQERKGRGDAFHEAFAKVDADAYIFFSPDGNEAIDDLKKFRPLLEEKIDLVIATRMVKGAVNEEDDKIFKWRKWAIFSFNFLAIFFFRKTSHYVTDSINGYRAITKKAADLLNLDARGYTIEYQMTIRALRMGLKITEFPNKEGHRLLGKTRAPSIPTGLAFLKCFFKELKKRSHHVNVTSNQKTS